MCLTAIVGNSLPKNPHPQAALFGRWEVGGRGSGSKG